MTVDPRAAAYEPSTVKILGGELHNLADRLEALLKNQQCGIYQRDGGLVEIAMPPVSKDDLIQRVQGTPVIAPVNGIRLRELGTRHGKWQSWDSRMEDWKAANCPRDVADTLANRSSWIFPSLVSVLGAPTIDTKGNIINRPGFHEDSGVFLHVDDWQIIKKKPTQEDARKALAQLEELVVEFPFIDAAARSVWLACLLTAMIRWSLRTAPLFGFDAPVMSSGKTLLASLVGLLVYGREPAAMKQPKDVNEEEKAIMAALMCGDPLLLLDNVSYTLSSDSLCIIATSEKFRGRVLGLSKTVDASTKVTIMVTGNNLTVRGDLSTRILLSRLDAGIEHPEERKFQIADIRQHAREHRQELVNAALTILRAHHLAGAPDLQLAPYGRFEDWAARVRAPLVWAGADDPCKTRERVEINDPERENHRQLVRAWWEMYGSERVLIKTMIRDISRQKDALLGLEDEKITNLREAIMLIAAEGRQPNPRRLGRLVAAWEGRLIEDLRLVRQGTIQHMVAWKLEQSNVSFVRNGSLSDRIAERSQKSAILQDRDENDTQISPNSPSYSEAVLKLIAQACQELTITPDQLAAKLSQQDIDDITSGKMTAPDLRGWAEHFDKQLRGERT